MRPTERAPADPRPGARGVRARGRAGSVGRGRGTARVLPSVTGAGRYIGAAIAAIIGAIDIHRVVLHGSVTAFGEPWLASVRERVDQRTLGLLASDVDISVADGSANLAVLGASA